jgi:4a-hydroxytetrahydrobiopterin dehydratase
MHPLVKKKCSPCAVGTLPLKAETLQPYAQELAQGWKVVDEHHLEKKYRFKNFKEAWDFTNDIAKIAEEEGHHPNIQLAWGEVVVTTWTHKINGLSESDFILAAKCEAAFTSRFGISK